MRSMRCPACDCDQPADNRYCEDCGARLDRPAGDAACPQCGGEVGPGGFCERCGFGLSDGRTEDAVSPALAGASDRGKRYAANEDAFALASDPAGDVLVVCDGVSSSQAPAAAARAGCTAARDSLLAALRDGIARDTGALSAALSSAHDAVAGLPRDPSTDRDPPEATIVAAVRRGRRVAVGWLGDSRAYYVTPEVARQLTADHSWLREEIEAGEITAEEGLRSPLAHAVTRTLGGPDGRDEPEARAFDLPPGPGLLLLCTDGLWAAFPDAAGFAREAWRLAAGGDARAVSRGLVEAAVERYGRDNATAAVLVLEK
jgi:serine/threonine protein phosphatase PrpC